MFPDTYFASKCSRGLPQMPHVFPVILSRRSLQSGHKYSGTSAVKKTAQLNGGTHSLLQYKQIRFIHMHLFSEMAFFPGKSGRGRACLPRVSSFEKTDG